MVSAPSESTERLGRIARTPHAGAEPEPPFDRIAALACELFCMPMAIVALAEGTGYKMAAQHGLRAQDRFDATALCAGLTHRDAPVVVPDIEGDPHFLDGHLPRADPPIRFYAGIPLIAEGGARLGALCLMDRRPRRLSERDMRLLTELCHILVHLLRLRRLRLELDGALASHAAADAELARQRRELWKQEWLLQQCSRLARIGGWEYHPDTGRIYWSQEVYRIHELPPSYVPKLADLPAFYPGEAAEKFRAIVDTALAEGRGYEFELPFVTAKGGERWVRAVAEVQRDDEDVVRIFGSLQDITERKLAEQRIEHLAKRDPLTGLPNRNAFQARLEELLADSNGDAAEGALVLIDIDHFKDINDTLGHPAGDEMLKEIARRISAVCRPDDLVVRLGGDEFAIILPELASRGRLAEIAERLTGALREPFLHGGKKLTVSASIGAVTSPRDGTSPEELYRNADIALSTAKAYGRNCHVFFDRDMRLELERRQDALASIRGALGNGELVPYYQPVISLKDGRLIGFEALLRWVQRNGIVAAPAAYRAALHDPTLSEQIGTHMIRAAVGQLAAWQKAGKSDFRVGVNIAASQFRCGRLAGAILDELDAMGVDPGRLAVEITETVLLSNQPQDVSQTLRDLHKRGVRIALDDFGTGYASLTHLRDFPVDTIKIDKSFVTSLLISEDSRAITQAIVSLSHSLGKKTIAEGVESVAVGAALRRIGCDWAQGYVLGRPMPPARAEELISRLQDGGEPDYALLKSAG